MAIGRYDCSPTNWWNRRSWNQSRNGPADTQKNGMTKRKIEYWVIPPDADGEFVAHMEEMLETYEKAYDPDCPVVCMDEQPVQLIGETRMPIPATKEHPERVDYEYERKGTASIFMFAEPLSGFRQATARPRRTKDDWAHEVAQLLDTRYANTPRITLVCDNLNTHTKGAFIRSVPSRDSPRVRTTDQLRLHPQARQLAQRGGMRTELPHQPMPVRPSHRRHRDPAIGNRRMGRSNKQQATGRGLAIYY